MCKYVVSGSENRDSLIQVLSQAIQDREMIENRSQYKVCLIVVGMK